jgi:4-amino-4-deoxy-L-arabinose transferase-like glycosyltransferase
MDLQKIKHKKQILIFLIICIFFIAFVFRVFPLRTAYWWDETVYLQHAEIIFSDRDNFNEFMFRPPLLPIIFAGGFWVWHSPIFATIIVALLGVLAPIFIYLIGKKIYGFNVGIIAGIIAAFSPFLISNSNVILTDVPALSLLTVAFYLLLFDNKTCNFLSGIFLSLAVLMKFTSILIIPVFLLFLILHKASFKKYLLIGLGFGATILPYLIWAQITLGNFLTPFIVGSAMVSDFNEPRWFYLFYNSIKNVFTFFVPAGLALLIISYITKFKSIKNKKYDLILLSWTFLFLAYLTNNPHKELRYLMPVIAPLTLLASKGLSDFVSLFKKSKKIIYVLTFFFIAFLLFQNMQYQADRNFKLLDSSENDDIRASTFIKNNFPQDTLIYTNYRWPVFAYYTGYDLTLLLPWDESFYSNYKKVMTKPGIVVASTRKEHEPSVVWLRQNKDFKFVEAIGEVQIFKYAP